MQLLFNVYATRSPARVPSRDARGAGVINMRLGMRKNCSVSRRPRRKNIGMVNGNDYGGPRVSHFSLGYRGFSLGHRFTVSRPPRVFRRAIPRGGFLGVEWTGDDP